MNDRTEAAKRVLLSKVDKLWQEVSWKTPRAKADQSRWEAVQACHAFHRIANPAYRDRCMREQIEERLDRAQLPAVAFPEEIYKAYSEKRARDGKRLGTFCERDVPSLLEHLNYYLVHPITLEGLSNDYIEFTNVRGGLDRLRSDLLKSQDVFLLTSSGTTHSAFSLIPFDEETFSNLQRVIRAGHDELTNVSEYGPIDPNTDCLIAYSPRKGSTMMAVTLSGYAQEFGERAFLTIPAHVQTKQLRWRKGAYAGTSGKVLRFLMKPLLALGGNLTRRKSIRNTIAALRKAEELEVRTALFLNLWMAYSALKEMEAMLGAEIESGEKRPGDPFVNLAPGSVLLSGGGNKSESDLPEEEVARLAQRLIGGLDKVTDAYGQAEGFGCGIRCNEGNYHLDPHAEYFQVGSYLACFDPRQTNRVPAILTGDVVEALHEEPCPCGNPSRYFERIERDSSGRGYKGCAAVLAEYR